MLHNVYNLNNLMCKPFFVNSFEFDGYFLVQVPLSSNLVKISNIMKKMREIIYCGVCKKEVFPLPTFLMMMMFFSWIINCKSWLWHMEILNPYAIQEVSISSIQ